MSLFKTKIAKDLSQGGAYLFNRILENNPKGVADALMNYEGIKCDANFDDLYIEIKSYVEAYPDKAADFLAFVLSVPMNQNDLTDTEKSAIVDIITTKSTGGGKKGMEKSGSVTGDDPFGGNEVTDTNNMTPTWDTPSGDQLPDSDPSFWSQINWGDLVQGALPGILDAFGLSASNTSNNSNNNSNNSNNTGKSPDTTLWIAGFGILLLIIVLIWYMKKNS